MLRSFALFMIAAIVLSALIAWFMIWQLFGTFLPSAGVNSLHVSDTPKEVFAGAFVLALIPFGIGALLLSLGTVKRGSP